MNNLYNKETPGFFLTFPMALLIVIILGYSIMKVREYNFAEKQKEFKAASKIYCPATFKMVKGDGYVTPDHIVILIREPVTIEKFEFDYMIDTNNKLHHYNDCRAL